MAGLLGFRLNHGGIQDYLDGGNGVSALLHSRASAVQAAAIAGAPVESGEYVGSIHIEEDHTDRMAVRVVADVPYALVVEAETGNLARALDAAG